VNVCGGSNDSIRVFHRIGTPCSFRRYSMGAPARIAIGRGVTTRKPRKEGVMSSRL
jgi:hypothetical protein